MKRILTGLLAAVMCMSMLVGCGNEKENNRLNEIKEKGVLTVATEPYFAPNEFIDPSKEGDEKYVGADIEMAKYIADKLGVELQIVPLEFSAVLSSVADGKYDLAISGLGYTPARAETMILSEGYHWPAEETGYGLLVREEDLDDIKGPEDLADRIVVAQSGSLQEMFMNNEVKEYKEFKKTSSTNDAALSVQEGKSDAASVAIAWAELYIEQNVGCGLAVVPDFKFEAGPEYSCERIGIPKGETALADEINAIIAELVESGQYDEWYEEYTEYAKELGL